MLNTNITLASAATATAVAYMITSCGGKATAIGCTVLTDYPDRCLKAILQRARIERW